MASIARDVVVEMTPPLFRAMHGKFGSEFETLIRYNAPNALPSQRDGQTDGHWHRIISARCMSL